MVSIVQIYGRYHGLNVGAGSEGLAFYGAAATIDGFASLVQSIGVTLAQVLVAAQAFEAVAVIVALIV